MDTNYKQIRHDWHIEEVINILTQPFNDLIFTAQLTHRQFFDPNTVQFCTLLSIKTGACPEDCKYCSQSGHYNTNLANEKLIAVQKVIDQAKEAKKNGATRFCMGAAWKNPPTKDFPYVLQMVKSVKEMGLETCMSLGTLNQEQAKKLSEVGLDFYNHNLDTSPEFYDNIITTRTYSDRLETLSHVRDSGINVCSGGILGLGEKDQDRANMLIQLANLPKHPESVPINMLVKIEGTPLEDVKEIDSFDFIRTIATARIIMPNTYIRLSAGRESMNEQQQSLAFLAGANSIFLGDKLLTVNNANKDDDYQLLNKLGIKREDSLIENDLSEVDIEDNNIKIEALYYDAEKF